MFPRITTLFSIFLFALFVAANVVPRNDAPSSSVSCNANTGTQQCCNSVVDSKDPVVGIIAGLLDVVLGTLTGLVGLTCSPIVGSVECNSQAVCCDGDSFNGGLLVIGCSPININL